MPDYDARDQMSQASSTQQSGQGAAGAGGQGQAPASGTQATQKHRLMAIGTPLGEDALLLRAAKMREEIGRLFRYHVDLLSENEEIAFDDIVGRNVTIRLETTKGTTRYFNGLVSSFAQRGRRGRYAAYEAVIVPWLWLLTRTSDCRIFQEKTVPDIIKEIFRDHGMTDFDDRLTRTYRTWENCVQYRETDFNFVSRLMEEEGIYYYFEHENGKHTLVLCDEPSAHQAFPQYDKISYRPEARATTDPEHIREWRVEKNVQPAKCVLEDFDFKVPKKDLVTNSEITRGHMASGFEVYDYPGGYVEYSDGEQYARVRIEELQARHERVMGQGDVRGIVVGYKVELEDYPRQDQCREHLITATSISLESAEYESGRRLSLGDVCACSFTGIPADTPLRVERITPKPLIQGPQTAVVVGPAGEEIYTDTHGRVKVQFHWDRRSSADETSSCWIRVAQLWAGKKWGAMFIPRIGQEVIVDFLEGDPDRPIITGRVYNGENTPPYTLAAEKTKSTIKTNSSLGGAGFNELRFEDKKGQEQIFIHAERNMDERVKADSMESIGGSRHLTVGGDQMELVEGDKCQQVKGDLALKVNGLTCLDGGQAVTWKAGATFSVDAADVIEFNSATEFVVKAASKITLRCGGSSIVLSSSGIYIKGPMVYINSGDGGPSDVPPMDPLPDFQPAAADTAVAGEVESAQGAAPPTPATYSDAAMVMKQAAKDGTPFCEQCERARREAEEAQKGGGFEDEDWGKKGGGPEAEKWWKTGEGPKSEGWEKKGGGPEDGDWGKKGGGPEAEKWWKTGEGGMTFGHGEDEGEEIADVDDGKKGKGTKGKW